MSELMRQFQQDRLIRLKEVLEIIPVSKSCWWQWVATGKAPPSIKLGERTTCWRLSDVMTLVEKQEV